VEEIERALNLPALATVISGGRAVTDAANLGIPLLSGAPYRNGPVVRDFRRLVEAVRERCRTGIHSNCSPI
jgi:hypothetical protein